MCLLLLLALVVAVVVAHNGQRTTAKTNNNWGQCAYLFAVDVVVVVLVKQTNK